MTADDKTPHIRPAEPDEYGRSHVIGGRRGAGAFDEETDDPNYADQRNFYKVEKWTQDGLHIVDLVYAGNKLDKALAIFAAMVKHRPRIRLTIRQRTRVLQEWPG